MNQNMVRELQAKLAADPIRSARNFDMFPSLPNGVWPDEINEAYDRLHYAFQSSLNALTQFDVDPSRLRSLRSRLDTHHLPVLLALERDGRVGQAWVEMAGSVLIGLMQPLEDAVRRAEQRDGSNVQHPDYVRSERTGQRGRPTLQIDEAWLAKNISNGTNNSVRQLAKLLNIDRRTLKREMDRQGIVREFSTMSDDHLDEIFRAVRAENPEEGWSYFTGLLRGAGIRVQQARIRACIARVAPLRQALRPPVGVPRHYTVSRPNSVWHNDGYHKLIRWGFVIHGFVDGYDHFVVGMEVHTNNRAETVFEVFEGATKAHGSPSRCRGDRGGENMMVAVWMIMKKGARRGSYLWGSSTRNTRIERLWREVGEKFARQWKAFFTRLERLHGLDSDNAAHIWLLQYLFLQELRDACAVFIEKWNHHPMKQQKYKSPMDKRNAGMLEHGKYVDDLEGVDPSEILRHYSVDRPYSNRSHDEEDDSLPDEVDEEDEDEEALADDDYDLEELEQMVEEGELRNVRHDAIAVPDAACPFSLGLLQVFETARTAAAVQGMAPEGYGLHTCERDGDAYPTHETIQVAGKDVDIPLQLDTWLPRATQWVCGLALMDQMLG